MASNLGTFSITCNLDTRKALYTPSNFNAGKYCLSTTEPTPVGVFGLFPVTERDGDSDVYFVCELPDGRCCYASVDQIQFIKDEEEAE